MRCLCLLVAAEDAIANGVFVRPEYRIIAQRVKAIIDQNVTLSHSYQDLATAIGVNDTTMKIAFKTIFDITIHQYVIERRLEFAYELILSTSDDIKDIARECGYDNVSHFGLMFKRKYGVEPSEIRKITR